MKKQQKEKIKKGLLTSLHILGYVCIGLTLITGIMVGVTQCNKETNFQIDSLDRNLIKRANDSYSADYLRNYNSTSQTRIYANDVYIVNPYSNVAHGGYSYPYTFDYGSSARGGVYLIDFDSNYNYLTTRYFVFSRVYMDGNVCYFDDNTTYQGTTSHCLMVFEDNRDYLGSNNYVNYDIFNNAILKVGSTFTTQNHGADYNVLNYKDYRLFLDTHLVRSYKCSNYNSYLYPFVLNNSLLRENTNGFTFPILPRLNNNTYGSLYWFLQLADDRLYLNQNAFMNQLDIFNDVNVSYGLYGVYGTSSNIGDYYSSTYGWGYVLYSCCYDFQIEYLSFVRYSYLSSSHVYSNAINTTLDVNIGLSSNTFNLNQYNENATGLNIYDIIDNGRVIYDGTVYTTVYSMYTWPYWLVKYGNGYTSKDVNSTQNPIFSGTILNCKYYELYNLINRSYGTVDLYAFSLGSNSSTNIIVDSGVDNVFDLIGSAFTSIGGIMSLNLFAGFTLGSLVFFPLIVAVILAIVKLFKR